MACCFFSFSTPSHFRFIKSVSILWHDKVQTSIVLFIFSRVFLTLIFIIFSFPVSVSSSRECLRQSEIPSSLHELNEDLNKHDHVLKDFQEANIPSDAEEQADDNDETVDVLVNEFVGSCEGDSIQKVSVSHVKFEIHNSAIQCKEINPVYSEEKTECTKTERTLIENLASHTVEEIFELLFSKDIFQDIIDYSIKYAKQNNNNDFNLTINELKIFFGILLLTGYHREPQEAMYWELLADTGVPVVYNAMTRERYREIKKYFHLCDNCNLDKKDKFAKLRPCLNKLESNSTKLGAEYNSYTGDVGMLDKQVLLYRIHIKSRKWWFSMFTQFLDVTVANAWRLYQKTSRDKSLPLLNARRKIVLSYLSKPSSSRKRSSRKNSISEKRVSKAIRLDEGNHFVQPIATQRRCAMCGKKTKRICTRCQVPLHDKCFEEFHSK